MIRCEYGLKENGRDANLVARGSSRNPWRGISHGLITFLECCQVTVGKGVRLDSGRSYGQRTTLNSSFSRLVDISRCRNSIIATFVDPSLCPLTWGFGFRRNLNNADVGKHLSMLLLLEGACFLPSRNDSRRWSL